MKNNLRSSLCFIGLFLVTTVCWSQEDKTTRPSPPAEISATIHDAQVNINYSSPSVKGRVIWGELVPFGKVWRTGANEATTFQTDKDIKINGEKLPAGKYSVFTIPGEKEWTFIFNSVWEQWGAYRYDDTKDVLRVKATPGPAPAFQEQLIFEVKEKMVVLTWENLSVGFEVK